MDQPDLTTLGHREALRSLVQRYARAIDDRDHDGLAALFDPEGTVHGLGGARAVPDYLDEMRSTPRAFASSMHHFADPLIELEPGTDEADMDSYAVVYQIRGPGEDGADLQLGMRYHDHVVRRDGRWVIGHRQTTLLWMRELAR